MKVDTIAACNQDGLARFHAVGALRACSTPCDLWSVCETAAVVRRMPDFSLATEIVADAWARHDQKEDKS